MFLQGHNSSSLDRTELTSKDEDADLLGGDQKSRAAKYVHIGIKKVIRGCIGKG